RFSGRFSLRESTEKYPGSNTAGMVGATARRGGVGPGGRGGDPPAGRLLRCFFLSGGVSGRYAPLEPRNSFFYPHVMKVICGSPHLPTDSEHLTRETVSGARLEKTTRAARSAPARSPSRSATAPVRRASDAPKQTECLQWSRRAGSP